jgi:hypothetical protein
MCVWNDGGYGGIAMLVTLSSEVPEGISEQRGCKRYCGCPVGAESDQRPHARPSRLTLYLIRLKAPLADGFECRSDQHGMADQHAGTAYVAIGRNSQSDFHGTSDMSLKSVCRIYGKHGVRYSCPDHIRLNVLNASFY